MTDPPAVPDDGLPSALAAAGAVISETSLLLTDANVSWETYVRLGTFIGQMNRSCAWWVGDLVLYGENVFGEEYAQIEQALGLAPQTIANRASVARHIPPERRRASLPFGVHAEVAYLEPKERDRWLDRCERGEWTRAKLREEMRAVKEVQSGHPVDDLVESGSAVHGDFLGDPEPDGPRHICPNCGHEF